MRLPHTIGEEYPLPGIALFHATFFLALHSVGRFLSGATPVLCAPRHCGQFTVTLGSMRAAARRSRIIGFKIQPNQSRTGPVDYLLRRHRKLEVSSLRGLARLVGSFCLFYFLLGVLPKYGMSGRDDLLHSSYN